MPQIHPLLPHQANEARMLIYTVAHDLFHPDEPIQDTITRYEETWPLQDVLHFEDHYTANRGNFFIMSDRQQIIATGALRQYDNNIGEIKRVWLLTAYHGQGLGYRMMMALIDAARYHGYAKIWLETAPAYQPRAYAFYHQIGFKDIPRYGDDPDDVGMELILEETS